MAKSGVVLVIFLTVAPAWPQTTQALIFGRVVDSQTGEPVTAAVTLDGGKATARTDRAGLFALPLVSPGRHALRIEAAGYQPQELHELDLAVASRADFLFRLRPLADVWEQGQYRGVFFPEREGVLMFFGPDVDTSRSGSFEATRGVKASLASTLSQVASRSHIMALPLARRDTYSLLVTQPGVTADLATGRGYGLSVNGQRPSASMFLLDGLENSDYLVSGPLATVAPEAVEEYRVSTSNFSAEYGRASGYLANVVTRPGGAAWHGLAYLYARHEVLNANGFQQNRQGLPRNPVREWQPGVWLGGPLRAERLFLSAAVEFLRFRSAFDREPYRLPGRGFSPPPGSPAARLVGTYRVPSADSPAPSAVVDLAPPSTLRRYLALPRLDWVSRDGGHRVLGRIAASGVRRPDFVWTPYPDFVMPLRQDTLGVALVSTLALRPTWTNEAKLGWSLDPLRFPRPHPEVPSLRSFDGTVLPGSPAFYGYRNRSRSWQLEDNLVWAGGSHVLKLGGGLLLRGLEGYLTAGRDGLYSFDNLEQFAAGRPNAFLVGLSRAALAEGRRVNLGGSDFDRQYGYRQFHLFAQDNWKLAPRLSLNYGLRYESFGAPRNTGRIKDPYVEPDTGASLRERLKGARLRFPAAGEQRLYDADRNNWAARLGFAVGLRDNARTLVRGAYGLFYDRPFDNLWQNVRNNIFQLGGALVTSPVDFLAPLSPDSAVVRATEPNVGIDGLTLYQPGLRDAYVHSYFFGLQHQFASSVALELHGLGALGRKLIVTDQVNREDSEERTSANRRGRLNPQLPLILYRSNQGGSNYHALAASMRYRGRSRMIEATYTWGHSIDNQSEPLAGDFFDLRQWNRDASGAGSFTRQFDSRADRGSADFDQRHNVVLISSWELPGGWTVAQLAAFRAGFPFSARAISSPFFEALVGNRPDLTTAPLYLDELATGGKRLLNLAAFRQPAPGRIGNLGRNALAGPGMFSIDLAAGRRFALPWWRESVRVTLLADVFNVLNHANLGNPAEALTDPDFGLATYGRRGREAGFPALTPLAETPRQVQLLLRVEF